MKLIMMAVVFACLASDAGADIVCADSSYCEVVFNRTYPPESQFAGQPYDFVTVHPDGRGETFANANGLDDNDGLLDIEIRVYLRNCLGEPCVGIPAEQISLFSTAICICPGGADADAATDADGRATFTGTLRAGGCASSVDVYVENLFIATLMDDTGRSVKLNSTDQAHLLGSPCFTDAGDLAGFAANFGNPADGPGTVCYDYNERDTTIDAGDLAAFAAILGASCNQ